MNAGECEEHRALIARLTSERDAMIRASETALREIARVEEARRIAEERLAELERRSRTSGLADPVPLLARMETLEAENRRLRSLIAENARADASRRDRKIDPFTSLDPGNGTGADGTR